MTDRFTVTALLAAHNEEDIVGLAVEHLISQGAQVYFIDHASTDGTVARIEPFVGAGVVAIERFPEESPFSPGRVAEAPWESILRRKEKLARELDSDWFIHQDADEFRESPWVGLSLVEAIERVDALGYNAIDFEVLEFPPVGRPWAADGDLDETFPGWRPAAEWRRVQVRCWKKRNYEIDLSSSGGNEVVFPRRTVLPVRFPVRHYPYRSQEQAQKKLRERRGLVEAERDKGWHRQYDDLDEDTDFVQSEDVLTLYEAGAIRLRLMEGSRASTIGGGTADSAPGSVSTSGESGLGQRDREIGSLRRRVAELEGELDKRSREVTSVGRRLMELEGVSSKVEKRREVLERDLEQRDRQHEALQERAAALSTAIEEANREIAEAREEMEHLSTDLDRRNRDLEDLEERYRTLEGQLADARAAVADAQQAQWDSDDAITEMKRSISWRLTRPLRAFGGGSKKT